MEPLPLADSWTRPGLTLTKAEPSPTRLTTLPSCSACEDCALTSGAVWLLVSVVSGRSCEVQAPQNGLAVQAAVSTVVVAT